MNIAIDIQTTLGQKVGMGFYVSNLVKNLQKLVPQHQYLLLHPSVKDVDLSMPQRWWWDQIRVPLQMAGKKIDIFHQPCFSAPLFWPGKTVVTVHDLILVLFPENISAPARFFFRRWMPFTYRRANHIIADSLATKNDLLRLTNIPEEKITVIHLGVEEIYYQPVPKNQQQTIKNHYHTGQQFILDVGTIEPRKNLSFLIEVFHETIKKFNLPHNLVITGKMGWYYEGIFQQIKELGLIKRVIFTGYVPDKNLPALYQASELFVFPSLYEGFGLPPLEAMASGLPVISSNRSSLPEVIGAGGLLISPTDKTAWREAIGRTLTDQKLARRLGAAGQQRSRQFTWQKCAEKTLRVYENVSQLH